MASHPISRLSVASGTKSHQVGTAVGASARLYVHPSIHPSTGRQRDGPDCDPQLTASANRRPVTRGGLRTHQATTRSHLSGGPVAPRRSPAEPLRAAASQPYVSGVPRLGTCWSAQVGGRAAPGHWQVRRSTPASSEQMPADRHPERASRQGSTPTDNRLNKQIKMPTM